MDGDLPPTPEEWAEKHPGLIISEPAAFFKRHEVNDKAHQEAVLMIAVDSAFKLGREAQILNHPESFKGEPYEKEIHGRALKALMDHPEKIFELDSKKLAQFFKDHPEMKEPAFRAASVKTPEEVVANEKLMEGTPYEKAVLWDATHKLSTSYEDKDGKKVSNQRFNLEYAALIRSKLPDDFEILLDRTSHSAAKDAPADMLRYRNLIKGKHYENEVMRDTFFSLAEIEPELGLRFKELRKGKDYEGVTGVALAQVGTQEDNGKSVMTSFNNNHGAPAAERFYALRGEGPGLDFDLITHARDISYNSTYNGVMDDLQAKLKSGNKRLTDILDDRQKERLPVFVEAAAAHHRVKDIRDMIPDDKLPDIMTAMTDRVARAPDMKEASAVFSVMMEYKDNDAVRHVLEASVKEHFEKAKTPEEKDKFGLLASAFASHSDTISPDMTDFYEKIKKDTNYHVRDFSQLTKDKLVGKSGISNQLMLFPGDPTGENKADDDSFQSFESWKDSYRKQGWKIEEKGSYVEISSTGGKVPVHIYGNRPGQVDEAVPKIREDVAKSQGGEAEFQQVSLRGHIYHVKELVHFIKPDMSLVELGACDGFDILSKVQKHAPNAQIVSTQGTGDITVNDPMMLEVNKSINKDGEIHWADIRRTMEKLSGKFKDDYVLPDADVFSAMSKKFEELHPTPPASIATPEKHSSVEQYRVDGISAPMYTPPVVRGQNNGRGAYA